MLLVGIPDNSPPIIFPPWTIPLLSFFLHRQFPSCHFFYTDNSPPIIFPPWTIPLLSCFLHEQFPSCHFSYTDNSPPIIFSTRTIPLLSFFSTLTIPLLSFFIHRHSPRVIFSTRTIPLPSFFHPRQFPSCHFSYLLSACSLVLSCSCRASARRFESSTSARSTTTVSCSSISCCWSNLATHWHNQYGTIMLHHMHIHTGFINIAQNKSICQLSLNQFEAVES